MPACAALTWPTRSPAFRGHSQLMGYYTHAASPLPTQQLAPRTLLPTSTRGRAGATLASTHFQMEGQQR